MKILILSDNHLKDLEYFKVLKETKEVDCVIHCGDSEANSISDISWIDYKVKGNNDFNLKLENELFFEIDNLNFFLTHGHLYNVNYGVYDIYQYIEGKNIDVVLFGHTHVYKDGIYKGVNFLNPGSTSLPRSDDGPTYMIYDTKNKKSQKYSII